MRRFPVSGFVKLLPLLLLMLGCGWKQAHGNSFRTQSLVSLVIAMSGSEARSRDHFEVSWSATERAAYSELSASAWFPCSCRFIGSFAFTTCTSACPQLVFLTWLSKRERRKKDEAKPVHAAHLLSLLSARKGQPPSDLRRCRLHPAQRLAWLRRSLW